jgi:predicted nuclease of predicted toxin-antitoxin system
MRFIVDMNLTVRWVSYLADAGHEAAHWSEIGVKEAADTEICAYARQGGSVVLTNDLDFPQILATTTADGPSVILMRGHPLTPEVRGEALLRTLHECERDLARGAILSLDLSGRPRGRILPLK